MDPNQPQSPPAQPPAQPQPAQPVAPAPGAENTVHATPPPEYFHEEPSRMGKILKVLAVIVVIATIAGGSYVLGANQSAKKAEPIATAPTSAPSPTPTPDPTADWKTYTNTSLTLSLKYPPDWYVDESNGTEYVRIQNFDPATAPGRGYDPIQDKGKYLVTVMKWWEKQGIKTLDELKAELPKDGQQVTNIGSPDTLKVHSQKDITVNGYKGLQREISYTSSIAKATEVYLLDGKGLVLHISPGLDSEGAKLYLEQILQTIKFTDQTSTVDTSSWNTYTSAKISDLSFTAFSIKHPSDWLQKEEITPGSLILTFTKKNHVLRIQQAAFGGGFCIFDGDDAITLQEYPYADYKGKPFVDLQTSIGKLRRVQTDPHTGQISTFFAICKDERPKDNFFTNPPIVGGITYEVPNAYENALLLEMDSILKTITEIK